MRQALEEATITTPPTDEKPFVSEGDVLAAWTTRRIASSDPRKLPVTTLTTVNLRYRFKSLMQTTGVYTQNLASAAYTFLSPAMVRGPLGPIALANRQHLEAQTTEPQLRAIMRTVMAEKEKKDTTLLFGEPNMLLVLISNWTKAKIMQAADFSPGRAKGQRQGLINQAP